MVTFHSDSLEQWLHRLEQLDPARIELGLERVRRVADAMDWPRPPRVVTVAGTNGKGSCVLALESLCREAGVRTGCYTSPHLRHFRERIRVDGIPASDGEICAALNRVESARGETPLTYFEFGTLAALEVFHRAGVEQWVLEVGLGGRLDAVNVIDADVAVITRIDLDHTAWLGETRELIGAEKAAVIRPGAYAVLADGDMPASVLDHCRAVQARVRILGRDFSAGWEPDRGSRRWLEIEGERLEIPGAGPHPYSLVAAAEAFRCLGYVLPKAQIATTLCDLQVPGRLQVVETGSARVVLDVAHNPDAARWLTKVLAAERWAVVLAMLDDKACEAFVAALEPLAERWYVAPIPDAIRSASVDRLAAACASTDVPVVNAADPETALARALDDGNRRVLVCGSFYTVGRCLDSLGVDLG